MNKEMEELLQGIVEKAKHRYLALSDIEKKELIQQRRLEDKKDRINAVANRMKRAGVAPRYAMCRLNNFEPKLAGKNAESCAQILAICQRYAAQKSSVTETGLSMIFCGSPGTGKTHLGAALVFEWLKSGRTSRYSLVADLLSQVKDTFSDNSGETESSLLNRWVEIDLLVLDEASARNGREYDRDFIFRLINARYEALKPTILISNLSPKELQDCLGVKVVDRLTEGGGPVLSFGWQSVRGLAHTISN